MQFFSFQIYREFFALMQPTGKPLRRTPDENVVVIILNYLFAQFYRLCVLRFFSFLFFGQQSLAFVIFKGSDAGKKNRGRMNNLMMGETLMNLMGGRMINERV